MTPILEGFGCYRRRDEAIRAIIPDYQSDWKHKIVLPPVTESDMYRVYSVVAQITRRTTNQGSSAARVVPADRRGDQFQAANAQDARVLPCRSVELRRGWDAQSARVRPRVLRQAGRRCGGFEAHCASLQESGLSSLPSISVCPNEIRRRQPTTDTYSLPQSQEEFYFSLPYDQMDLCLYAKTHGFPAAQVAPVLGTLGRPG